MTPERTRDGGLPTGGVLIVLLLASVPWLTACRESVSPPLAVQAAEAKRGAGATVHRAKPTRSSDLVPLPFFVRDGSGERIEPGVTSPATLLHEAIVGNPVLAPDGDQVTWGEWSGVEGHISVKCVQKGTHAVLHLSGLIPRGVYTIWNVVFEAPGFTGEFDVPGSVPANVIGFGPSGSSDGSSSAFRASASGRASISTVTPPGDLGVAGDIGGCALTDEFEWHVVGLYHIDGETYGSERGPEGTRAEQFAFIFGGE